MTPGRAGACDVWTAGATPALLIGREVVVDEFDQSLLEGAGSFVRLMRITGNRGIGKTVPLTRNFAR